MLYRPLPRQTPSLGPGRCAHLEQLAQHDVVFGARQPRHTQLLHLTRLVLHLVKRLRKPGRRAGRRAGLQGSWQPRSRAGHTTHKETRTAVQAPLPAPLAGDPRCFVLAPPCCRHPRVQDRSLRAGPVPSLPPATCLLKVEGVLRLLRSRRRGAGVCHGQGSDFQKGVISQQGCLAAMKRGLVCRVRCAWPGRAANSAPSRAACELRGSRRWTPRLWIDRSRRVRPRATCSTAVQRALEGGHLLWDWVGRTPRGGDAACVLAFHSSAP